MFTINEKSLSNLSLNLLSFKCSHAQGLWFLLLYRRPSCIHLKKKKKKKLVQLIFQAEKEKRKSSLKFAGRNQNAICSSCFYFSLCKSQEDCSSWFTKRKVKNKMQAYNWFKCKNMGHAVQSKVQGCIQSKLAAKLNTKLQ